jgi:hypothetical protein
MQGIDDVMELVEQVAEQQHVQQQPQQQQQQPQQQQQHLKLGGTEVQMEGHRPPPLLALVAGRLFPAVLGLSHELQARGTQLGPACAALLRLERLVSELAGDRELLRTEGDKQGSGRGLQGYLTAVTSLLGGSVGEVCVHAFVLLFLSLFLCIFVYCSSYIKVFSWREAGTICLLIFVGTAKLSQCGAYTLPCIADLTCPLNATFLTIK